jgi:CRISPR-associated protein Csd1
VQSGILPVINDDRSPPQLIKEWDKHEGEAPPIFRLLPGEQAPEDAFVRWRVEEQGVLDTGTWEDQHLVRSWQAFYSSRQSARGLCLVTGETSALADQHPKKIRHSGDRAKLISSNDTNGFTFLGRFANANQAASVSFEVTQKAHNALRWLIGRRQASRNGDQVFVSWAIGGQTIPTCLPIPWKFSAMGWPARKRINRSPSLGTLDRISHAD